LLSDQFNQIGADEHPLPSDLRSGHLTRPCLAQQTVFTDAQEYRSLCEAESGRFFLLHHQSGTWLVSACIPTSGPNCQFLSLSQRAHKLGEISLKKDPAAAGLRAGNEGAFRPRSYL
jgi:hypothetical protein